MSLRNTLDCRALKMPGYLSLLNKADKQRTKDPGLCNLGCRSLATILRCSQGGGGRMSSRQEAPSVAIISLCRCGRKPCRLPWPAPGRSTKLSPAPAQGPLAQHRCQRVHTELCKPTATNMSPASQPGSGFSYEQTKFFRRVGAGRVGPSRAWGGVSGQSHRRSPHSQPQCCSSSVPVPAPLRYRHEHAPVTPLHPSGNRA